MKLRGLIFFLFILFMFGSPFYVHLFNNEKNRWIIKGWTMFSHRGDNLCGLEVKENTPTGPKNIDWYSQFEYKKSYRAIKSLRILSERKAKRVARTYCTGERDIRIYMRCFENGWKVVRNGEENICNRNS